MHIIFNAMDILKVVVSAVLCVFLSDVPGSVIGSRYENVGNVPVLSWAYQRDYEFSHTVSSGKTVYVKKFVSDFLEKICEGKGHVFLFLQDKLSLTDISLYGNIYTENSDDGEVFKNIKLLMEEPGSFHLERVESPADAVIQLAGRFEQVVHMTSETSFKVPRLTSRSLVMVHLPETSQNDPVPALKANDRLISEITSGLRETSDMGFTAIYTAQQNSQGRKSETKQASGRKILSVGTTVPPASWLIEDYNYTLINMTSSLDVDRTCILLYYDEAVFYAFGYNWTLPRMAEPGDDSVCYDKYSNETYAIFNINYTLPEQDLLYLNMSIFFEYDITQVSWITKNWTIMYHALVAQNETLEGSETPIPMATKSIWAPIHFSYACSNTTLSIHKDKNTTDPSALEINATDVKLYMKRFQIQLFFFNTSSSEFGRYNHCVGFFNPMVWSSLIVMFTLLVILLPAIQLLSGIKVMDRYDDPRGKTISVKGDD